MKWPTLVVKFNFHLCDESQFASQGLAVMQNLNVVLLKVFTIIKCDKCSLIARSFCYVFSFCSFNTGTKIDSPTYHNSLYYFWPSFVNHTFFTQQLSTSIILLLFQSILLVFTLHVCISFNLLSCCKLNMKSLKKFL